MYIDKEKLTSSFDEWEERISGYSLPLWDDLPDIELYMEQIILLIRKYLAIYYEMTDSEKFITPSMINNYVKLEIIPSPKRKKYSRIHLAYLLIVCTLKQTLDMATIQKIIPIDLSIEDAKSVYNSFVENQHKAFLYVTSQVHTVAAPILSLEGDNQQRMNDLLFQVASSANIFKILTEKITKLPEERPNGQH